MIKKWMQKEGYTFKEVMNTLFDLTCLMILLVIITILLMSF